MMPSITSYLSLDENRNVIYAAVHLNGIQSINLSANPITYSAFSVSVSGMSSDPYGLYYSLSSDTLYVADYSSSKIFNIRLANSTVSSWSSSISCNILGDTTTANLNKPINVVYGNNRFYFVDEGAGQTNKILTYVPRKCILFLF